MVQRVLSYLIFAVIMTVMITSSIVFVIFVYAPFVVLKALYLAASGRFHEAIGPRPGSTPQKPFSHPG